MAEQLNHHNDPGGITKSLETAGKDNFLGDIHVIDKLLRQYVSDVMNRYNDVTKAKMAPNDAVREDQKRCIELGRIFDGGDASFTPVPNWSGKPLADFVRNRMYSVLKEGSDLEILSQVFAILTHRVYDAIGEHVKNNLPESEVLAKLNSAIHSTELMLMGVESNE